jgi:Domain of unknown function (DUF4249)
MPHFMLYFKKPYILFGLFLCLLNLRCISDIELKETFEGSFVVVDAVLKLSPDNIELDSTDFKVKLNTTLVSGKGGFSYQVPIKNEKVELVINQNNTIILEQTSPGTYYLKDKSLLKKGNLYQLRFSVGEKKYESTVETMPDSVPMSKVYVDFNPKSSAQAHQVFVDVIDVPQVKNYYNWTYTLYEKQEYCSQCYIQTRGPAVCKEDLYPVADSRVSVSLICGGNCWDIIRNKTVNVISDQFFDGKLLLKKNIGYVPFNFFSGCLVEVQQMSATGGYYQYLELLKSVTSGSGGLVDTPPAVLVGNVKNTQNREEKVIGYFTVVNTTKKRIWIDRKDASKAGLSPISFINPSIPPPAGAPVTTKACTPSEYRTNVKPSEWRD